jgi:perosamine synthetase
MTDIQAAIGREQLKRLPAIVARRRNLADRYRVLLADLPGVVQPVEPEWARSNWQSFSIRLPEGSSQTAVMQYMLDQGISTRRGIMCSHLEPAYEIEPWSCGDESGGVGPTGNGCSRLRESERAQRESIILPLFHQMTEDEQQRVVDTLGVAIGEVALMAAH